MRAAAGAGVVVAVRRAASRYRLRDLAFPSTNKGSRAVRDSRQGSVALLRHPASPSTNCGSRAVRTIPSDRTAHQRSLRETSGGFAEGLDCGQGIPKWQVSGAPIVFPQDFHRLQKRLRRFPIFSVDRKLNIVDCQNISSIVKTRSSIANVFLRLQKRYRRLLIFFGDSRRDILSVRVLLTNLTVPSFRLPHLPKLMGIQPMYLEAVAVATQ